jgi:plasmid stabilization system protein ParE
MACSVVYAPRALRDLQAIETYLLKRSTSGARNVLTAIKATIDDLAEFPKVGIPIGDNRYRMPVRRYGYLVYYRVAEQRIFILHVRHGARKPVEPGEV